MQQNLLRGLIKCGVCGLNYISTGYKDPGAKKAVYYQCSGKTAYRGPTLGKCSSKAVPKEWIEDLVWNDVVSFIMHPGDAIAELGAAMETRRSRRGDLETEWSLLLQTAQDKNTEKQSILDLFRRQLITASDVEIQLQKITKEKKQLDVRARKLEQMIQNDVSIDQQFSSAEAMLADLREKFEGELTFEVKRQIVKALVKEILINTYPVATAVPGQK